MSKRVLVTGASRGIGRAIARRLASGGWDVGIHCNRERVEANDLAREIGPRAAGVYVADLAQDRGAADLWCAATQDGPVHALVNNAGVYHPLQFLDATDEAFEANLSRSLGVNFIAPARLSRLAGIAFRAQGGGKILNVASRVGFRGEAGASLYSASKASLINLTRALAVELAPHGIGCFGIAPGWVETALARDGMGERLPQILKDIPLGRVASVEDCSAAAAFLLSDEAAYLSGVVLDINGASYFH